MMAFMEFETTLGDTVTVNMGQVQTMKETDQGTTLSFGTREVTVRASIDDILDELFENEEDEGFEEDEEENHP